MADSEQNDCEGAPHRGGSDLLPSSGGRTLEVTGLGLIVALILSFWTLVSDGTLPLPQYLVFVAMLLISAAALVWRLRHLSPAGEDPERRLPPGAYRVVFGGRDSEPW